MSTSSAPSSTALRASATLRSVGYWPDGKPVATAAIDAGALRAARRRSGRGSRRRRSRRTEGMFGSLGSGRIAFEQSAATLPGRVGALERRQIHAADRELEREDLRVLLDRALRERCRALLERDRVDRADARQPRLERQLEPGRECRRLRHDGQCSPGTESARTRRDSVRIRNRGQSKSRNRHGSGACRMVERRGDTVLRRSRQRGQSGVTAPPRNSHARDRTAASV